MSDILLPPQKEEHVLFGNAIADSLRADGVDVLECLVGRLGWGYITQITYYERKLPGHRRERKVIPIFHPESLSEDLLAEYKSAAFRAVKESEGRFSCG